MKVFYIFIVLSTNCALAQTFGKAINRVNFADFESFDRNIFAAKNPVYLSMGYSMADPRLPKIDSALISLYYGSEYINQFARTNLHYDHPSANGRKGLKTPDGNLENPGTLLFNGLK